MSNVAVATRPHTHRVLSPRIVGVPSSSVRGHDLLRDLGRFRDSLDEYAGILGDVWPRAPGYGWFGTATDDERQRVERLRADLTEMYGALHDAIAEAHGGEPIVESAGIVGGDAFLLALADPSDNPWLSDALDMSRQAVTRAVGYQRMRRSGRLARMAAVGYREAKDWARILGEAVAKLVRPS